MCSFKSIYFVIFILNLYETNAQISDKRLCLDPDCKEPVSLAKTLLRYSSPDARILSFAPNMDIKIYSKEAGSVTSLWGAEIRGKRGYVPKHLIREYKVLKVPKLLVDTELKQNSQVPVDVKKENVRPDKVQEPFEVVDGTTIYLNPQDGINPTSTDSTILSTAAPSSSNEEVLNAEILNTVEDSKINDATTEETNKESVVDNVVSTFSNWMSDDSNSEELEDLDDDDDDEDEDEEEDEEESLEETTSSEKTEDINSLHNLPPGVKLSPYNLELDQSIKENVEKENIALKENIVVQQKPNSEVSSPVVSLESNNNIPLVPEHIQVNSRPEVKQTSEDKTSSNLDTLQSEKNEEIKREIDDKIVSNTAKMETATETTFVEEEPLPILDIITPNPIEVKIEEKPKTEDIPIVENSLPETAPPQENLTLNKNKNQQADSVPSPIDTIKTGLTNTSVEEQLGLKPQSQVELVQVSGSVAENNLIENPIHKEDEKLSTNSPPPPLLGGLFNKAQNLNLNENTEKAKVGIPVEQSLKVDNSKEVEGSSNEVLKYNLANKEKIVEEPSIQVNHLNDFSKQESTSEEKLVNNLKEESNDIKENLVSEEKTGNVLRDELINQSDLINDVSKQEPTSEKQIVNVSKEESANQEQILSDEDSKEIFLDPKDEIVTGILKDVANELTNEEHVVSKENIDEDYDSKEGTEENKPLEGEEYSNDNIIRDERKAVYDDINGEVLNDYGGNLEEPSNSVKESDGFISGLFSFFGSDTTDKTAPNTDPPFSSGEEVSNKIETTLEDSVWSSKHIIEPGHCDTDAEVCKTRHQILSEEKELLEKLELNFNSDIFLYLITTAISVILFLFGYMALDRNRREAPLVAIINKLEKQLLITLKENEILQENSSSSFVQEIEGAPNEFVEQLAQRLAEVELMKQALEGRVTELEKELEDKEALVEQIENLEKELETSTEVGMELNRIISEMLDPTNGSERLKENVEQLQRQLLEQKDTISSINESLRDKEAENTTLHVELERNKKKVIELQNKLDDMAQRILKIEKEKDQQQNTLQNEITVYLQKYSEAVSREDVLNNDIQLLRVQLSEVQRQADIKAREYQSLKESLDKIKSMRNDSNALRSLLDATSVKAELQQLRVENERYVQQLQDEQTLKQAYEKKYQVIVEEINVIKQKYEQADKEKVEVNSKLEVLNNYFKKRESELQEEVIKYKSIWDAKEGEATSSTERIKYMQEEIENYKAQNETLKQEIISQEIELKSQISMLEKKVHENWVVARQTDRKLEDARQEAAQLRNRLTLRERAIHEERAHNRLQSPVEQNGELPLSPHPIDSPASPPLLYGRDHITKSPPLPGLPPFLPPPPGAPFMPPPIHGMPPVMPPPPSMYPGDHRPPPLGRMSSPPLNSRYSPDASVFSPYDRNSPSPPYDSEYGTSPPPLRGYSPYNSRDDRRDYKRPPHARTNGRNMKGSRMSSGSEHSNDSLDKINRKQSKMV